MGATYVWSGSYRINMSVLMNTNEYHNSRRETYEEQRPAQKQVSFQPLRE
jgi:hypothetical protein